MSTSFHEGDAELRDSQECPMKSDHVFFVAVVVLGHRGIGGLCGVQESLGKIQGHLQSVEVVFLLLYTGAKFVIAIGLQQGKDCLCFAGCASEEDRGMIGGDVNVSDIVDIGNFSADVSGSWMDISTCSDVHILIRIQRKTFGRTCCSCC